MSRPLACTVAFTLACLAAPAPARPRDDLVLAASPPAICETAAASAIAESSPPRRPAGRRSLVDDPYRLLSSARLFDLLEELTAIRPHLGWRTSTSSGEAAALDWVEAGLGALPFLASLGLDSERHGFRTFTGVEFRETIVTLRRDGVDFTAPADSCPGHRDIIENALRFDSDGVLNDRQSDPQVVQGPPLIVRSASQIDAMIPAQASGRVVLLDYAVVDRSLMSTSQGATATGSASRPERCSPWSALPLPRRLSPTAPARCWCSATSGCSERVKTRLQTATSGPTSPPTRADRAARPSPSSGARPADRPRQIRPPRAAEPRPCPRPRLSKRRGDAIVIRGRRFVVDDTAQRTMEG